MRPTTEITHYLRPFWAVLLLLGLFLAGCVTPGETERPERLTGEDDPLAAPGFQLIGTITLVDPEEEIALIQVRSASTRLAPQMVSRNETLEETARLEPTRFQRGRTLGARILSGLPNVGDEVYIQP